MSEKITKNIEISVFADSKYCSFVCDYMYEKRNGFSYCHLFMGVELEDFELDNDVVQKRCPECLEKFPSEEAE